MQWRFVARTPLGIFGGGTRVIASLRHKDTDTGKRLVTCLAIRRRVATLIMKEWSVSMRYLVPVLTLSALAACQPGPNDLVDLDDPDACGASGFQFLVGQPLSVLETVTLPEPNRIIGPGQPVTADFMPTRINVSHGPDGVIGRVYCV